MKKRNKIFNTLVIIGIFLQPIVCFSETSMLISFYRPSVTTDYDYKGKDIKRKGLSAMLGIGAANDNSGFGGDFFIGGGTLGSDIGEFIIGGALTNKKRFLKERIAIPVSLGIAFRPQYAYIENKLVAMFIDEPKFLQDTTVSLSDKRTMRCNNFDFMPSIDLQIFISEHFSLYAGYMYRINSSGDWSIDYKIPGKSYKNSEGTESAKGDWFNVPKELNPLADSKERGVFRFGIAINLGGLL
jgi:hypothetical protein